MKEVFEGTAATVAVRLTKGRSDSAKTAKLVFNCTEGAKIDPATLQLPAKPFVGQAPAVKHKVVFPDVPANKDSYQVTYHVEWDGKQVPGPERWTVWPAVVDLTTKRRIDGKLTQTGNFVVQLVQGESRKDYLIQFPGKSILLVPEPGPFDLQVPSPERFVNWLEGKDKGRVRVLEWDIVPHKASIESPVAGDEPIRTYMNFGTRNELKVEVITSLHTGGPAPNQDVYVEVVFENPTRRGKSPQPGADDDYKKERTVETLTNLARSNSNLTWKGKIKSGADGKGAFTVFLGKGGGEKCTLKVGSTASVEDDQRVFESWRKVFVQHTHSDTKTTKAAWPASKRGPVKDAYAKVFIELDFAIDGQEKDKVYPDLRLGERCGWVDGAEIDGAAGTRCFVINTAGTSWKVIAKDVAPQDAMQKPLYINIAACDLMFETKNVINSRTVTGEREATWKGTELSTDENDSFGGLPSSPIYEQRVFYTVYTQVGRTRNDIAKGDVPPDCIKVSSSPKSDRGFIKARLPDSAIAQLPPNNDWKVRFEVQAMMKVKGGGGAVGMSDGKSNIVLAENANGDKFTINTIIHEIGHAIGMCGDVFQLAGRNGSVNRLPDYTVHRKKKKDGSSVGEDSFKEHSRWYSERAHQGGHCATGLNSTTYEKWGDLDGILRNLASYSCVIYGQDQALKAPQDYCPECSDMLKAMEVWVGPMPKSGGG